MKHSMLLVLTLLGIITMSAIPAAAGEDGPRQYIPSWDQTIPTGTRFIELTNMPGAVLDRETGLVWEQTPSTTQLNLENADQHCRSLDIGNRYGWRLPSASELSSLLDATYPTAYQIPYLISTIFTYKSAWYWSTSTVATNGNYVWIISTSYIQGQSQASQCPTNNQTVRAWCVRGPGAN